MNVLSLPFEGEAGVGMGLFVGKRMKFLAFKPHPPPSLPLEGGGAKRPKAFMRKAVSGSVTLALHQSRIFVI
jgi:hypothetical protein